MELSQLTDEQRNTIRKLCLRDLYWFCKTVMGYDDITEELHGAYCRFLQGPEGRKQSTMPRSFVKTWIGSIAFPIWISLPREEADEFPQGVDPSDKFYKLGSNIRILIASYVISNAEKMISLIRKTYESNVAMQILFPEVIPDNFKKVRWSNQSACINRSENFTESTFEAAGIGGASTSRHYDIIIEDDLIYASKDDFSGKELQPNQEDIDKAIGWHKLATSLLVPGRHTRIHNQGTRWAKHDLVDYIWRNEPGYVVFRRAAVKLSDAVLDGEEEIGNWEEYEPSWNEAYDLAQLKGIRQAQGLYMFATQYLLMPMSPEQLLFKPRYLQWYDKLADVPEIVRKFTTIDLAGWEPGRIAEKCNTVVLTCGWCNHGHMWILGYDYGRFTPTEVIFLMAKHWNTYQPEAIYPEGVYYQRALAHFARVFMDDGKVPRMTIRELMPEGGKSKETRILALEPLATSDGIHCRKEMQEWITEFTEYSPSNRLCKKDLLDAAAYQVQIYRPGVVKPLPRNRISDTTQLFEVSMDSVMRDLWDSKDKKQKDPIFHNGTVKREPFNEEEESFEGTMEELIGRTPYDPYNSDLYT